MPRAGPRGAWASKENHSPHIISTRTIDKIPYHLKAVPSGAKLLIACAVRLYKLLLRLGVRLIGFTRTAAYLRLPAGPSSVYFSLYLLGSFSIGERSERATGPLGLGLAILLTGRLYLYSEILNTRPGCHEHGQVWILASWGEMQLLTHSGQSQSSISFREGLPKVERILCMCMSMACSTFSSSPLSSSSSPSA